MPDLTATSQALYPLIRTLLSTSTGQPTASTAVDASVRLLGDQLTRQLVPLIGEGGVTALGARSLHLTQIQFPWLVGVGDAAPTGAPFAQLCAAIVSQEPETAIDAASTFMATFCELLADLIGSTQTVRLLREAWPSLA